MRHRLDLARAGAFVTGALVLLSLGSPARAANTLTPQGYIQYAPTYGDTYNGVTTDDGDHLAGSFSTKMKLFYRRFAVEYQYYRDLSSSQVNAMTPSGGPGTAINYPSAQVIVPAFTASDGQSEFRLEYQPAKIPVYFGLAQSNSFNNYNFPRLTGVGIGVELQPDLNKLLSPYGSFYYFPDQTGTYPLANPNDPNSGSVHSAFIDNELDLGAAVTFPKINLTLVLGYFQNTNVRKTGTFNFVRDGPYIGLGYRVR